MDLTKPHVMKSSILNLNPVKRITTSKSTGSDPDSI